MRAAHDDQKVEALEGRNRLAGVELDGAPVMPGLRPEGPENARVLDGDVLKNQNAHHGSLKAKRGPRLYSGEFIYIQEKITNSSVQENRAIAWRA